MIPLEQIAVGFLIPRIVWSNIVLDLSILRGFVDL